MLMNGFHKLPPLGTLAFMESLLLGAGRTPGSSEKSSAATWATACLAHGMVRSLPSLRSGCSRQLTLGESSKKVVEQVGLQVEVLGRVPSCQPKDILERYMSFLHCSQGS